MSSPPIIWKKRILVPFWTVRICLMVFLIGIYAWAIALVKQQHDEFNDIEAPAMVAIVIFMLFIVAVLLIDILAIILFLRDALKPMLFLVMSCFQTGFWGGVLIMNLVAIGQGTSAVGLGLILVVFLSFLGLLIYAGVGYHRQRMQLRRGQYAPAHNPSAHTNLPEYRGPAGFHQPTAYKQPNNAYHPQGASHIV
ncbi:hypothetical protein BDV95DRAFT_487652 [Massariosphaeria phaeospora]|uniref:MARVEL domain-containing protein n=1 Tax=Massariosphaeria phaeospora TaxID=100035 RepID=A0A7C8IAE2_9PLEO|nr:hypothetical protein BDV95DRAFT_487652 [Massariosphaeria phaeospora]